MLQPQMRNIQLVLVPVGFKLGISFSPLHADGDHPIENEEACGWYSVGPEECDE